MFQDESANNAHAVVVSNLLATKFAAGGCFARCAALYSTFAKKPMALSFQWAYRELGFAFEAATSRGVLKTKPSYFVKLFDSQRPEVFGVGEAGLIPGLSPDPLLVFADRFPQICHEFCQSEDFSVAEGFPAIRMALETAFADLMNGGKRIAFDGGFSLGQPLAINGLIWMADYEQMRRQIDQKIAQGFTCIKLKIGALDWEQEKELLRYIRDRYGYGITIRLDANGAFGAQTALEVLKEIAPLNIHSVEQPIAPGQWDDLQRICRLSPVPVAVDEELFCSPIQDKIQWAKTVCPQFFVLKPTLLGGFGATAQWIAAAEAIGAGYWLTSALESNIALNAIAQYAFNLKIPMAQGLGTGTLFTNNIASPLRVEKGQLRYHPEGQWLLDLAWR